MVKLAVQTRGLLNYAKQGPLAVKRIRIAMRKIMNVGRKTARQRIASQFVRRTGVLQRQARRLQTKVTVKASEIKGQVTPIPRLMNIFESGALLAKGRGVLHPRPVVGPGQQAMNDIAAQELQQVLREVGK
jgi:hypothetical protein